MRPRIATLTLTVLAAVFILLPAPLRAQQTATAQEHQQHHPATSAEQAAPAVSPPAETQPAAMAMMARMKATTERLDALVTRMNAAQGQAKTDAIAELLTALVEERRDMCGPMMAGMMSMMNMKGDAGPHGESH
jgi:formate dehydrogenase maturation protein FdhE